MFGYIYVKVISAVKMAWNQKLQLQIRMNSRGKINLIKTIQTCQIEKQLFELTFGVSIGAVDGRRRLRFWKLFEEGSEGFISVVMETSVVREYRESVRNPWFHFRTP